ncbi:MAG: MOSC domain-containing protein [Gemmatimonadales bacterium]|nr:MOSC domain-containing protein [Gemmatimonadales bacterium]
MPGKVQAICISRNKGEIKEPVAQGHFVEAHGLEGDAHAGPWHRQVSLLADESIQKIRRILPELADGAFAENIVTKGIDLLALGIGKRLELGDEIILEITQIGKECHSGCAIREITGDCVMPREGIFCRVIRGGILRPGDPVRALAEREATAGKSDVFPMAGTDHA